MIRYFVNYFASWEIWDVLFLFFMYFWGIGMLSDILEEDDD